MKRAVSISLGNSKRDKSVTIKLGGEEILVVLPGAAQAAAREIAERLRYAVAARRPIGVEVTISIGVAVAPPGLLNTDELVEAADAALYSAKANGRDRVIVGSAAEVDAAV